MMRHVILLAFLSFGFSQVAWTQNRIDSNGLKQGEWKVYYGGKQSSIQEIRNYRNDTLDGEYKLYWKNGALKIRGNFTNGLVDGYFTTYWPNGKIKSDTGFIRGRVLTGERTYNKRGKLVMLRLSQSDARHMLAGETRYSRGKERNKRIWQYPYVVELFGISVLKPGEIEIGWYLDKVTNRSIWIGESLDK